VHGVKEHFTAKIASAWYPEILPLVRTVHGARKAPAHLSIARSIRSNSVVSLDNFLIKYAADAVIAVSRSLQTEFYKRKVKGKTYQIYNAINTNEYEVKQDDDQVREQYGTQSLFWIGTAARLVEPKNLHMLIKAGKYLEKEGIPFKISIFGDGPLRKDLENLVRTLSLSERVELCGFKSDVISIINALDVFVLCSIHEGLPMVLLEAMFLDTPVVCTNVDGINELVQDSKNGLLVPLDDCKSLADSLIRVWQDGNLVSELTKNAHATSDEMFSIDETTAQLFNVYKNTSNKVF
jgi:glycosyltransferase involved in cell wall biosynthesis